MLIRLLKHLASPGWWARRAFRADDLAAITQAIQTAEARQRGEIRVAIEASLPLRTLFRQQSCRDRAADLFPRLGVDQTREANGVLIYIQLIDRQVEILADHGIAAHVETRVWADICTGMEQAFARGEHRSGTVNAIAQIGELLAQYYPATDDNPNELGDAPAML